MEKIPSSAAISEAQLNAGYASDSKFHEVFAELLAKMPQQIGQQSIILNAACINTVLGPMIGISDNNKLYLLEFFTAKGLEREIKRLQQQGFVIVPGDAPPLTSIKAELTTYFSGMLTVFKTPYQMLGSPFQQQVWQALCQIPYGETRSYAEQSASLGKPSAYRAVANANGANQLAIIIPCHRVIASDGTLGGYGGGLMIKQWLIEHEQRHKTK